MRWLGVSVGMSIALLARAAESTNQPKAWIDEMLHRVGASEVACRAGAHESMINNVKGQLGAGRYIGPDKEVQLVCAWFDGGAEAFESKWDWNLMTLASDKSSKLPLTWRGAEVDWVLEDGEYRKFQLLGDKTVNAGAADKTYDAVVVGASEKTYDIVIGYSKDGKDVK